MRRNIILIILIALCAVGCARVQGIRTLMRYSKNTELQKHAESIQTKRYLTLKENLKNTIGLKKHTIIRKYGRPTLKKEKEAVFLYRKEYSFCSEKIYLTFNSDDKVSSFRVEKPCD